MKYYLSFLLVTSALFAYSDSDFDGVEDAFDRCPNSTFSELVDAQGCVISTLNSAHSFDIIAGLALSQNNQKTLSDTPTIYTSLQVDYFYKNFTANIIVGTYSDENTTATNDTVLGVNNRFYIDDMWSFSLGGSIILPTYETGLHNEATDFAFGAEVAYSLDSFSAFLSSTYTFVNDKNTQSVSYQNTNALFLGFGYVVNDSIYTSLSYYNSQSIYTDIENIETISMYLYYLVNNTYFLTCNYSYGLSQSASENYLFLRFGINF